MRDKLRKGNICSLIPDSIILDKLIVEMFSILVIKYDFRYA
ncbi:MAG: hypothetical protein Q4C95_00900 [Planctomycetia bacterium]|nr:hypothetical protein [Planctomycetia bacterium]